IPIELAPMRTFHAPVRMTVVQNLYATQMRRNAREVFQLAPEPIDIRAGLADHDRCIDDNGFVGFGVGRFRVHTNVERIEHRVVAGVGLIEQPAAQPGASNTACRPAPQSPSEEAKTAEDVAPAIDTRQIERSPIGHATPPDVELWLQQPMFRSLISNARAIAATTSSGTV